MRTRGSGPIPIRRSAFAGFRFPPEMSVVVVRWYLRFGLSYREVEELLAEAARPTDRYANNHIEADHGHRKSRLRPMLGLK
jgi:transposase-like protein